jgi:hypothetical protein
MKLFGVASLAVFAAADNADLTRAKRTALRAHFTGEDHADIRVKLNAALQTGAVAMPKATECAAFTLEELAKLEEQFFHARSPELFTSDLRAPKHDSIESLRADVLEDSKYVEEHPEVSEALRDSRCAELAMQWVHQLSAEARAMFKNHKVPLLAEKGTREHAPNLIRDGHYTVTKKLANKVTCQVGHDAKAVDRGTWEGFPAWPYEVTYNASGYGPYPFWTRGGGSGGSLTGKGIPIYTRWSSVLNAERLEHAACSTSALFGVDKPCTHLFLGSQIAYLFSQDESHCCQSSYPGYACHLTTMQRDFYKVFQTQQTLDNYVSEHGYYRGQVKKYSMHLTRPSNFWFWYVTDMNDRPVEQGEGPCDMYSSSGDRNCRGPPKMLFHQYDTESFSEATLDPEVFAVPDVCKNTKSKCVVQPTHFCGDVEESVVV